MSAMKRFGFGGIDLARCSRPRSAETGSGMRAYSNWQWHLDEVFVKINGETHYLWRAVDHEGEVLESYVTKRRDRKAALKFLRKSMKRYGQPEIIVTDKLRSYGAAMKSIGNDRQQETGRWLNNRAENSHSAISTTGTGDAALSGKCDVCRNSPLFILPSTTTSIRNASLLLTRQISSSTARCSFRVAPTWCGISSLIVLAETGSNWSDTTVEIP